MLAGTCLYAQPNNGLVAYYPFDNSYVDMMGNNPNANPTTATPILGETYFVRFEPCGIRGQALDINGMSAGNASAPNQPIIAAYMNSVGILPLRAPFAVEFPLGNQPNNINEVLRGTNAFTISFWFKTNNRPFTFLGTTDPTRVNIFSRRTECPAANADHRHLDIRLETDAQNMLPWRALTEIQEGFGGINPNNNTASDPIDDACWVHYAVSRTILPSGEARLSHYINGVLVSSITHNSVEVIDLLMGTDNSSTPLARALSFCGSWCVSQKETIPFDGFIDEFRVYNRALSDAEVAELQRFNESYTANTPPGQPTLLGQDAVCAGESVLVDMENIALSCVSQVQWTPTIGVANPQTLEATITPTSFPATYTATYQYTVETSPTCHSDAITIQQLNNPLSVEKTASSTSVTSGNTVTYTIRVCNNCLPALSNVAITDALPQGLVLQGFPAGGIYDATTHTLYFGISNLSGNTCQTFTVTATAINDHGCNNTNAISLNNGVSAQALGTGTATDCAPITVSPNAFCTPSTAQLTFSQAMNAGLLAASNTPNQTVVIEGQWTVDVNYVFAAGTTIIMKAGARINVTANATLTLDGTIVRGCECMWNTIHVDGGARLRLQNNSELRDAQYAVEVVHKSDILVKNTMFRNNFIGIYSPPPATGIQNPQTIVFNGANFTENRFDGNTTKPPFVGITPLPVSLANTVALTPVAGTRGLAGIWVHNVFNLDLRLGSPFPSNQFNRLTSGIVGVQSNVFLNSASFSNIQQNTSYNTSLAYNGTAVYAIGSSQHRLEQIGNISSPYFNNCRVGVAAQGMNMEVRDNRMNNIQSTGIASTLAVGCKLVFVGNRVQSQQLGVACKFNDPTIGTTISNNNITVSAPTNPSGTSAGIYILDNNMIFPNHVVFAEDNQIMVQGGASGILLNGNGKGVISENNISLNNTPYQYGISMLGSSTYTTCNDISGIGNAGITTPNTFGLYGSFSLNNWTCNTINRTYYGMRFDQFNSIQLKGNRFDRHSIGLHISASGIIGTQFSSTMYNGNRWIANANQYPVGTWEARNDGSVINNQFKVNANNAANNDFVPNPRTPSLPASNNPSSWFYRENSLPNFDCNSPTQTCDAPITPLLPPAILDSKDTTLALGVFTTNDYVATAEYTGKRHLYRKIHEQQLAPNCALFQGFCQNNATSCVGQFDQIQEQTKATLPLDAIAQAQVVAHVEYCTNSLDTLRLWDSLYLANPNTALAVQIENLRDALIADAQQKSLLLDAQQSNLLAALPAIESQNNALSVSITPEEVDKQVNTIYLSTIAKGSMDFNASQLATLQSISALCPLEGGMGVYMARGMLNLVQPIDVMDRTACNEPQLRLMEEASEDETEISPIASELSFMVYPNPAVEYISLYLNQQPTDVFSIDIIDITGRVVLPLQQHSEQMVSLPTQRLPAGIYVCRLHTEKGIITQRFVVAK